MQLRKIYCSVPGLSSTFFLCHLIPAAGFPPTTMHFSSSVSPSNTSTVEPLECCEMDTDEGGTEKK